MTDIIKDARLAYLDAGAEIIKAALATAVRADPADAPFPLVGDEARIWHRAQAQAYCHALEMMAVEVIPEANK